MSDLGPLGAAGQLSRVQKTWLFCVEPSHRDFQSTGDSTGHYCGLCLEMCILPVCFCAHTLQSEQMFEIINDLIQRK